MIERALNGTTRPVKGIIKTFVGEAYVRLQRGVLRSRWQWVSFYSKPCMGDNDPTGAEGDGGVVEAGELIGSSGVQFHQRGSVLSWRGSD